MKTIMLKNVHWFIDKTNNVIIPITYNQDKTFVKNLLDDQAIVINLTDLSFRRNVARSFMKNYGGFKVSPDFDVVNSSYFFARNVDLLPMVVKMQYKKCDTFIEQANFIDNYVKDTKADKKFLNKVCKKFKSKNKTINSEKGRV